MQGSLKFKMNRCTKSIQLYSEVSSLIILTFSEIIKGIVKNYVCEVFIEQSRKTFWD